MLGGYEQAVRLAALLRLEGLCEALVSGLADAAGLTSPAPHSSPAEAKQVAALSKLINLGSCSEAGMLGTTSWLVLLRALSQLERLQAALLPGARSGLPPLPDGAAAALATSSLDGAAAVAAAAAAAPPPMAPPPQPSSSFGRLLQRMGFAGGSSSDAQPGSGGSASAAGGRSGLLAIKDAPGAGHVLWAETAGRSLACLGAPHGQPTCFPYCLGASFEVPLLKPQHVTPPPASLTGVAAIERLVTNSGALHGDAVLCFTRALCAVSQEELHPQGTGGLRARRAAAPGCMQRLCLRPQLAAPHCDVPSTPLISALQASGRVSRCCSVWSRPHT